MSCHSSRKYEALNTCAAMNLFPKMTLLSIFFLFFFITPAISDTLNTSQSIRNGETLVSSGGMFELGFFGLGNSSNRWYLGIWYRNITVRTYVWVANREAPLENNTGVLRLTQPGILALFNNTSGTIIWSSNATRTVGNPTARLLDSGNLVVKDATDDTPENYLWQSFDYPTDTFLPGMSIGWNYVTGVETFVSSWRSEDDPAQGEYSLHLNATGYPQLLSLRGNNTIVNRLGPWNGIRFSGAPDTSNDRVYTLTLLMNRDEVRYRENIADPSVITRSIVSWNGNAARWVWNSQSLEWIEYRGTQVDNCDIYNTCGANGICNVGNSPPCQCLHRFITRDQESWTGTGRSSGCFRRTELNCFDDVFLIYPGIKLPDARNSTTNDQIVSLSGCEAECSRNCNCTAYTQLNISGSGSGCLFYYGDLIDIRTLSSGEQDLYIRMASSERANVVGSRGNNRVILIASLTTVVVGIGFICLILVLYYRHKKKDKKPRLGQEGTFSGNVGKETELPFFTLSTILKATDSFSNNNKLGEGGFGPVYKGMLEDGQEIAVKRLSKTSKQGVDELKNEVILIAKLQHRNLVRTLGCCAEEEENMLIYEYMSNNSLDLILFDSKKSVLLDWEKRINIINGIAKGLLYLHQDSRLRIIHRDLKASNILLDADMIPKISDFGLARSFRGNQTEAQTHRVVGTYGYMSPEYAIDGLFSIKSDVFSFGVLVLEIVSGKRNRGFFQKDHNLNLLGHAWTLFKEGNSSKVVDPSLGDSFDLSQVLRSIHVGLLCVQKSPEDRPNMSSVVFMLGNEVELPKPKQPGFFTERDVTSDQNFANIYAAHSQNQVTITWMEGR